MIGVFVTDVQRDFFQGEVRGDQFPLGLADPPADQVADGGEMKRAVYLVAEMTGAHMKVTGKGFHGNRFGKMLVQIQEDIRCQGVLFLCLIFLLFLGELDAEEH